MRKGRADGGARRAAAAPDNQHALSGSRDYTVKLFNVNDGAVLRTISHVEMDAVLSLALLPDGRRFVAGSDNGDAFVIEHGLAPHAQ